MKNNKNPLEHDALIQEISDDVKNDELQKIWNKYGLMIIVLVVICITATVSFETFKTWRNRQNQEISNAYAVAISLQSQGKLNESLAVFENIIQETSNIYKENAKLQIADIYFKQGKQKEAVDILEKVIKDSNNKQMQEIAVLKLIAYKIDNNESSEEIKKIFVILDKKDAIYNVATEFMAMLALRDGDVKQAKAEFEKLAASPNVSEKLKSRAQDMLSLLNEKEQI